MAITSRNTFSRGWMPDADPASGPSDALLRMDNCVLDELGIVALRPGSAKVNWSPLADLDVHSLLTAVLGGVRHRLTGAGASIYDNGVSVVSSVAGSGDIAFGTALGHAFMARSTTKKKTDGTTVRNWGIAMTGGAPTTLPVEGTPLVVATCDQGESPAFSELEGDIDYKTGYDGLSATGSLECTAAVTTGRNSCLKTFTTPLNCIDFNGVTGDDSDLLEAWIYVAEPTNLMEVTFSFSLDISGIDRYTYTFTQRDTPPLIADAEEFTRGEYLLSEYDREAAEAKRRERIDAINRSTLRPDKPIGNVGWNKLVVRRGAFTRSGATSGKDWTDVMVLQITTSMVVSGAASVVRYDSIQFRRAAVIGTQRYRYRLARTNADYVTLSAPSEASGELVAQGESVRVACPADASRDSQVTEVWLYRWSDQMGDFYRVATQTMATVRAFGYTANWEFAECTGTDIVPENGCANYTLTHEATDGAEFTLYGPSNYTCEDESTYGYIAACGASTTLSNVTGAVVVTDETSDIDALRINIRLNINDALPPDDIVGIAGPYYDRLFCLTAKTLHPSRILDPESYNTDQGITVGDDVETAYWVVEAQGGLYVGTSRDIYRLDGTGAELPDGTVEFQKRGLNIDHPPVGAAVAKDGPLVVYLAHDGWRALAGVAGTPLVGPTSLLYKGFTRHGVSPVNTATGRFRAAISKGQLVAITPEGSSTTSSTVVYRYSFSLQRWYRHIYPVSLRSVVAEPDGTVLVGDTAGTVWSLDTGTDDGGTAIPVTIWTMADPLTMSFLPKEAANVQQMLDTGGSALTVVTHLDASSSMSLTSSVTQTGRGVQDIDLSSLDPFNMIQFRLTGSFTTFLWGGYLLVYQTLPLGVLAWDSGPMDLGLDEFVWLRQIRMKVKAGANLTVTPYFDGAAFSPVTMAVGSHVNKTTVLDASVGRGYKGKSLRVLVTSSAKFYPYWVEFLRRTTGEETEKKAVRVSAHVGGEAIA